MTSTAEPLRLGESAIHAASLVLSRAFQNDPLMAHVIPDPEKRCRLLPKCFEGWTRYCVVHGEVYATSPRLEGIVAWLPPSVNGRSLRRMVRARGLRHWATVRPSFFWRLWPYYRAVCRLEQRHAPVSRWYLQWLGVDPQHQGQGHAGCLLRAMFASIDRDRLPCCLSTAGRQDVSFYQHFGFRLAGAVAIPGTNFDCVFMIRP